MDCTGCLNSKATHKWDGVEGYSFCSDECAQRTWDRLDAPAKRWIQRTHMKRGAFKREARRHHRTEDEEESWARGHGNATEKRRANLRRTLRGLDHK